MSAADRRAPRRAADLWRPGTRKALCAGLIGLALLAAALPVRAETRLALVIGNSGYQTNALANPKNDATLIAATLTSVGFDVIKLLDADQALMKRSILDFGRRLRASDSVGLFYYAGHGVQVDGENYLIPVGADIHDQEEVALSGVSMTDLMKTMERAGSRLNIAILDACRDNPFASSTRSGARGLAPVTAPTGTIISYATAPGQVALDGTGDNSPYSTALAEAIPTEGAPLEEVFRSTRRKVLKLTGGKQVPWEHSSLTGDFYFKPKIAEPQGTARADDAVTPESRERLAEIKAWEKIKSTKNPDKLRAHIEAYPEGYFHELAEMRLKALETHVAPWGSEIITGSTHQDPGPGRAEVLYERAVKLDAPSAKPRNLEKAAALYREAADLGLPVAMFSVGRAYDKGRGLPRDPASAAQWYRKAADNGHAEAMASLGSMYEFGEGVGRDLPEALRLYSEAAEAGVGSAMASLGYLYQTGKGVSRQPAEARRWYAKAVKRDQPRAMFNLALMLISGEGGRTDLAEAARLLQVAADKNYTGALRELATLYDEGRGVARSSSRAADLLLKAFRKGDPAAKRDLLERPDTWSFSTRRAVQRRLARKGLYRGRAHGFFNDATRKALQRLADKG